MNLAHFSIDACLQGGKIESEHAKTNSTAAVRREKVEEYHRPFVEWARRARGEADVRHVVRADGRRTSDRPATTHVWSVLLRLGLWAESV